MTFLIHCSALIFTPLCFLDIPALWHQRINFYIDHLNASSSNSSNSDKNEKNVTQPSKFGNKFIYSTDHERHAKIHTQKLICYYTTPRYEGRQKSDKTLKIKDINPHLCTHLNIGIIEISNCSLVIDADLIAAFKESNLLKAQNEQLKVMLWVGGADESMGFSDMVENHANRKRFIQSLKATLEKFALDGVGEFLIDDVRALHNFIFHSDLDWEFPNGSNPQRIHFMQLLHEIRREYQREHSTYLLSLAVAAPSAFVEMCYDVPMINENVDWVNVMTYDYHFYSTGTPYVGELGFVRNLLIKINLDVRRFECAALRAIERGWLFRHAEHKLLRQLLDVERP